MKNHSAFRSMVCTYEDQKVLIECYKSMRANEYKEQVKVYIYRQVCHDFTFGVDYDEYTYSLNFEDATLIFKGVLEEDASKSYYAYEDNDVKEGTTYAYYVKSEINDIVYGPVMVKPRNIELWLPYDEINKRVKDIKDQYKNLVTIKTHGHSIEKREIDSITIGNASQVKLAFIGIIHAGEAGPELMLHTIVKLLENNKKLLEKVGISFLMNVNPDMREKLVKGVPWYLRKNANGVDLNRNFDCGWDVVEYGYGFQTDVKTSPTYRGDYEESEPETIAVLDFYNTYKPEAVFVFHCLSSICTDSFLVSKYAKGDTDYINKCMTYLEPYTKGFDVHEEVSLYYATSYGSLPHYLYKKYNIPAFDMELGEVSDEIKDMVVHDHVTIELMDMYKEKHYKGICEVLKNVYS